MWSAMIAIFKIKPALTVYAPTNRKNSPNSADPLKADESLIVKYIQAISWFIANDIRENLQRFPDANQSKNTTRKWRKLNLQQENREN